MKEKELGRRVSATFVSFSFVEVDTKREIELSSHIIHPVGSGREKVGELVGAERSFLSDESVGEGGRGGRGGGRSEEVGGGHVAEDQSRAEGRSKWREKEKRRRWSKREGRRETEKVESRERTNRMDVKWQ